MTLVRARDALVIPAFYRGSRETVINPYVGEDGPVIRIPASAVGGGDPLVDEFTRSLAYFNGANNDTTTTDEIPGVSWALIGGAVLDTSNYVSAPSSLFLPDNSSAEVSGFVQPTGTEDFTLEFRFWAVAGGVDLVSNNNHFRISPAQGGTWTASINLFASSLFFTMPALFDNTWYHIVFQREGTVFSVIVDGAVLDSQISSEALTVLNGGITTLTFQNPGGGIMVDDFRLSTGVARYSGDALASFTAFLGRYEAASLNDEIGPHAPTLSGAVVQTNDGTMVKWGVGAISLPSTLALQGQARYSTFNPDLSAVSWTMEGWFHLTSGAEATLFMFDGVGPGEAFILFAENFYQLTWLSGGVPVINTTGTPTVSAGVRYHVAVVRNRVTGFADLFFDGVRLQHVADTAADFSVAWLDVRNNSLVVSTTVWDDVRVSLGSARYDGATYTVPAAPFVVD